jgi:hypothetical protein
MRRSPTKAQKERIANNGCKGLELPPFPGAWLGVKVGAFGGVGPDPRKGHRKPVTPAHCSFGRF